VEELIASAVFGLILGAVFLIIFFVIKKIKNARAGKKTGREKNLEKIEKMRGGP
jgi:uncharacterized membrane protein YciS (DUF1049 family)